MRIRECDRVGVRINGRFRIEEEQIRLFEPRGVTIDEFEVDGRARVGIGARCRKTECVAVVAYHVINRAVVETCGRTVAITICDGIPCGEAMRDGEPECVRRIVDR